MWANFSLSLYLFSPFFLSISPWDILLPFARLSNHIAFQIILHWHWRKNQSSKNTKRFQERFISFSFFFPFFHSFLFWSCLLNFRHKIGFILFDEALITRFSFLICILISFFLSLFLCFCFAAVIGVKVQNSWYLRCSQFTWVTGRFISNIFHILCFNCFHWQLQRFTQWHFPGYELEKLILRPWTQQNNNCWSKKIGFVLFVCFFFPF